MEAAVRVYGGAWVDVGCWRGPGANYRRGPGVSACEPGRNHGGDRGETRRGRCSAGKAEEGDGTAMRARAVSGRSARSTGGVARVRGQAIRENAGAGSLGF